MAGLPPECGKPAPGKLSQLRDFSNVLPAGANRFGEQLNHLPAEGRNIVWVAAGYHTITNDDLFVYPCTTGVLNIGFQ